MPTKSIGIWIFLFEPFELTENETVTVGITNGTNSKKNPRSDFQACRGALSELFLFQRSPVAKFQERCHEQINIRAGVVERQGGSDRSFLTKPS